MGVAGRDRNTHKNRNEPSARQQEWGQKRPEQERCTQSHTDTGRSYRREQGAGREGRTHLLLALVI